MRKKIRQAKVLMYNVYSSNFKRVWEQRNVYFLSLIYQECLWNNAAPHSMTKREALYFILHCIPIWYVKREGVLFLCSCTSRYYVVQKKVFHHQFSALLEKMLSTAGKIHWWVCASDVWGSSFWALGELEPFYFWDFGLQMGLGSAKFATDRQSRIFY